MKFDDSGQDPWLLLGNLANLFLYVCCCKARLCHLIVGKLRLNWWSNIKVEVFLSCK